MSKKFNTMGVINVTPNSFSDGSKFNQSEDFEKQISSMEMVFDIIDIGAESTAPKNHAISASVEIERLEKTLISYLKKNKNIRIPLSIDTYKTEVFEWALIKIRSILGKDYPLIFNDVSGKVDDELLLLMDKFKFKYILSHNLCPDRFSTSNHMNFIDKSSGEEFLENISLYFKKALDKLLNSESEVILDPCFGFSKTREQNHYLIANFSQVFTQFKHQTLFGVSRKSFLQNDSTNKTSLDVTQAFLLAHFVQGSKQPPIFRLHDMSSVYGMDIANDILSNCQ